MYAQGKAIWDVTSTFEITNAGLVWGYSIMELRALGLVISVGLVVQVIVVDLLRLV